MMQDLVVHAIYIAYVLAFLLSFALPEVKDEAA